METNNMAILEQLVNEFYAGTTSNTRKHDIEMQLEAFKQDNSSWKHCLCNLTQNNHAYVWMYAINIIEDVIMKRWHLLEIGERTQIKEFLWKNFKSKSNCTTQRYQTNKLAKLLSDVAKREFPQGWQEYFHKILEIIRSNQCHLGIVLLHVTCEEIVTRNDISSQRKEQLITSLNGSLDHVFTIITQLFQSIMNKWSIGNTPPCSPNEHVLNEAVIKNIMSANDSTIRELCFELLCTVQHLFSWVELADYVSSDLLNILFALADATSQNSETISIVALSAITEILYRKCAFAGLSTLLCGQIMQLICHLNCLNKSNDRQITLTDSYLEKTTELIRTFVVQHYSRMLSDPTFDSLQFMSLLFHYTFVINRQSVDCYMGCLEVWCILLDYINNTNLDSYKNAILSIAASCFNSIVFSENEDFLSSIDTETVDDDLQSDWQHFLKQCFELISKISEFYPREILSMVLESWKNLLSVYAQISNALNTVKQLNIQESEIKRVLYLLYDLSTLSQCLSRLASIVSDANTSKDTDVQLSVHVIISKAIEACQYSNKHELYAVECPSLQVQVHLQHVHANLLLILSSYTPWLAQTDISTQITDQLVLCAIQPLTSRNHPHKISNIQNGTESKITNDIMLDRACATLLLNVSKTLRPQNFLNSDIIQNLFSRELDDKSTITLHQSIINNLTLPWQGVTNQNWNGRGAQLINYTTNVSLDFLNIPYNTILSEHSPILGNAISVLKIQEGVLKYFEGHSSSVKALLKSAYEPLMDQALKLINHQSLNGPISESIMSFFLTALMVLQHQLGAQFTGMAVTGFMNAVKREQLSKIQLYTVDKLLQILKLIVLLPGQAFKGFLPNIISLALDNISPLLNTSNSEEAHDANLSLLSLFDAILQHRWQYFYRSQVLLGNSPVQTDGVEELNHVDQLQAMLLTYGQCLLNGDLTVFGTCLQSLDRLNDKWRIYHKPFFRNSLLPHFLSALLQSLLNEQLGILFDNILIAIYKMAVVDLITFCNIALIMIINSKRNLTEQEATSLLIQFQVITDEPTFIQNLAKLMKDLKCAEYCNT